MKRLLLRGIVAFVFTIFSVSISYSQICPTAPGDQVTPGSNSWIGYAYQAKDDFSPVNYIGYFNEPVVFNESFCGDNCSFPINGCALTTEQFSVRFMMNLTVICGDYIFTIGGDDGVRLSIDGGPYIISDYGEHGYQQSSSPATTLTEGTHTLVLDFYENTGGNQVSFSYVLSPTSPTGPGTIGASQTLCQAAPFDPAPFTSIQAAIFCSGAGPNYQWQESADQVSWSNIIGATSDTYDLSSYSTLGTRYFRRSVDNGTLTGYSNIISVTTGTPPGDPAVYGNNVWNAYGFNSPSLGTNYYGYYTESNLSFNTATRFGDTPSNANSASGAAFAGCNAIATTNYTVSLKRTNFTCGYYQIDMPYHDDDASLWINGSQVFEHIGCCDAHTNIWTGFLGPTSQVEARYTNYGGPGALQLNVALSATPAVTANTPVIVCAGSTATLTATSPVAGVTYSWAPDSNNLSSTITTPSNTASIFIMPTASGDYIVTITDPLTGCQSFATVPVTVAPAAMTAITVSPTTLVTDCPGTTYTLTVSGAASYIWSADTGTAGGLSATTGFQVTANPQQTTTYTVYGATGCNVKSDQVTITVNAVPVSTFPTNTWNVYGFNSQTIGTSYVGYYTEDGTASGPNTYSFDTQTRWASGGSPSSAVTTASGNGWIGCAMNDSNISLSFKRTGFACGVYQLDVPEHDDEFFLLINGVQVAQHIGCCDSHTNVWTGVLGADSQVEWQLKQGGGGSNLGVVFTNITQPAGQSTWLGGVSTDWFNAANWCGGVPTSATNVLIPAAGPKFMPAIAGSSATCQDITISAGVAASDYGNAIAAASLTTSGSNNLDVNGNWANSGTYVPNTGSITFAGTTNTSVTSGAAETFYNLIVNKSGTATVSLAVGIQQVSHTMSFANGIVTPVSSLLFLNGSAASGASNTSYVAGPVQKLGMNAFDFPVGQGGFYRPISISAPSTATDSYTAQYFFTDPNPLYSRSSKDVTLNHIGGGEYWMLNRNAGSTDVMVTLSWASTTGGVDDLANLRVAGWNGSQWHDWGNSATTGDVNNGTVQSAASPLVSVFGPFTIASANANNPLPISLIDFTCTLTSLGLVEINWSTLTELNNDYFDVERSTNGINFTAVQKRIKGAGTSSVKHTYSTEDISVPVGKVYYRLKQVDFGGMTSYSEVRSVEINTSPDMEAYPNPASNEVYIDLHDKILNAVSMTNLLGSEQHVPFVTDLSRIRIDTSSLPSGLYLVRLVFNEQVISLRVVIRK